MTGQEVYDILVARGVTHLHHVNSVQTSLSMLGLGGLASRQLVEQNGLPQTSQYTDSLDREYGIWGDVFMDTVDIHERRSGRNQYGPVLFLLNVEVLRSFPTSSRVLVTRSNPTKWGQTNSDAQRYFLSAAELNSGLNIGNFDQMLVIRTVDGIIPFMHYLQSIILDEPRRSDGFSFEFNAAASALATAASRFNVQVMRRSCSSRCDCTINYAKSDTLIPRLYSFQ